MLVPFTDENHYSAYRRAIAANLSCERIGDLVYRVSSEGTPGRWYRVTLEEDRGQCNCQATAHCKHLSLAAAREFPWLLSGWLLAECQRMREERHEAERKGWRASLGPAVREAERETKETVRRFRRRQEEWEEWQGFYLRERVAA